MLVVFSVFLLHYRITNLGYISLQYSFTNVYYLLYKFVKIYGALKTTYLVGVADWRIKLIDRKGCKARTVQKDPRARNLLFVPSGRMILAAVGANRGGLDKACLFN